MVISFVVALVCTTLVPAALIIILAIKKKISGLPLLFGALAFFISQILLRVPIISVLSTQGWYQDFATMFVPYILVLCFTAGLFEESARLGGALILKKKRSFKDVISFGLGHGLCEVVILIGLTHVNNLICCLAINNPGGVFAALFPPETLQPIIEQLTAAEPYQVYMGLLERVSAVIFHIFATVLVFRGVVGKKWWYYILAIIAHMLFNLVAVLLATYTSIVITEVALLVLALASGVYVLKSRNCFDGNDASRTTGAV